MSGNKDNHAETSPCKTKHCINNQTDYEIVCSKRSNLRTKQLLGTCIVTSVLLILTCTSAFLVSRERQLSHELEDVKNDLHKLLSYVKNCDHSVPIRNVRTSESAVQNEGQASAKDDSDNNNLGTILQLLINGQSDGSPSHPKAFVDSAKNSYPQRHHTDANAKHIQQPSSRKWGADTQQTDAIAAPQPLPPIQNDENRNAADVPTGSRPEIPQTQSMSVSSLRVKRGAAADGQRSPQRSNGRIRRDLGSLRSKVKKVQKKIKEVEDKVTAVEQTALEIRAKVDQPEKRAVSAHFYASVDPALMSQAYAQNTSIRTEDGEITPNGFIPDDKTYRFWKVSNWTNTDVYMYHASSGHVTVMENGTYLIHAQILFHDLTGRNSYGVYVNNEREPFAQCLAYQVRPPPSRDPTEHATPVAHHLYQQCSTLTVRHIDARGYVQIKGVYEKRSLLAKASLTFWGMVKLD